jgi:hypothetical protein
MVQMTQKRTRHPKHIWYQQYRYLHDPNGNDDVLRYALLVGEFMTSSEHTRIYNGRTVARRVPLDTAGKPIDFQLEIVPKDRVPAFIFNLLSDSSR